MIKDMERIKLDKEFVKKQIPLVKNIKELAALCDCGTDKVRHFIIDNGLYKYYCEQRKIPYDSSKENQKCSICGEAKQIIKLKGICYCKRHFNQMYRYGEIFESTIYDRNEIIIMNNYAIIKIKDVKQNPKAECIIDIEDIDKVKDYKWYSSYNYCVTKALNPKSATDIANVIFNDFENKYDHINHNRLDNRKINLRPVTSHQNAMNMGKKNTNTSGVTGVQQQLQKPFKWYATITYKYKYYWLGSYHSFDEAVKARLLGEIEYFGEYSPHYNPETKTIQLNYHSRTDNKEHFLEYSLKGELLLCM